MSQEQNVTFLKPRSVLSGKIFDHGVELTQIDGVGNESAIFIDAEDIDTVTQRLGEIKREFFPA